VNQVAAKFDEAIKENSRSAHHWKRERNKLRLEEIPGEEREELEIADVEQLKGLDQDELEQEVAAIKEGIAAKRPDLVS